MCGVTATIIQHYQMVHWSNKSFVVVHRNVSQSCECHSFKTGDYPCDGMLWQGYSMPLEICNNTCNIMTLVVDTCNIMHMYSAYFGIHTELFLHKSIPWSAKTNQKQNNLMHSLMLWNIWFRLVARDNNYVKYQS